MGSKRRPCRMAQQCYPCATAGRVPFGYSRVLAARLGKPPVAHGTMAQQYPAARAIATTGLRLRKVPG
jgi:hypothetical protein